MKKLLYLSLLLVALSFTASASHLSMDDKTFYPDDSVKLTAECTDGSAGCPALTDSNPSFELCNANSIDVVDRNVKDVGPGPKIYEYVSENFVPTEKGCKPGKTYTGKFNLVGHQATSDVNIRIRLNGKYLNIKGQYRQKFQIHQMHMTNKRNDGEGGVDVCLNDAYNPPDKGGYIIASVEKNSCDQFTSYRAELGEILRPKTTNSFEQLLVADDVNSACSENFNQGEPASPTDDGKHCQEDVDKVVKEKFKTDNGQDCGAWGDPGDNCYLAYDGDTDKFEWWPRGEIIVAYENDPERDTTQEPRFFMCDPTGKTSNERKVVFANDKMYQCQSTGLNSPKGEWDRVYACNNNIDDDFVGGIDYDADLNDDGFQDSGVSPDANCDSPTYRWEEPPKECKPKINKTNFPGDNKNSKVKAAWYDGKYFSKGCKYGSIDKDVKFNGEKPVTFTCKDNSRLSGRIGDFCDRVTTFHGSNSIKAVEYYVPKSAIPTGKNRWATESGFKINSEFQTLHHAEARYDGGSDPEFCESCHDKNTWATKGDAGLQDLGDGYTSTVESDGETDYTDSWGVANATAQTVSRVVGDGTLDDPGTFQGGFYGKCGSTTKWQFDTGDLEWICSGSPSWEQRVMLPDLQYVEEKSMIGLIIMPYNWKAETKASSPDIVNTWKEAIADYKYGGTLSDVPDGELISEVQATCWPSDSFQMKFSSAEDMTPDNSNAVKGTDYFRKIKQIDTSRDRPLPVASEVAVKQNTTYTCKWIYRREDSSLPVITNSGNAVNLASSEADSKVTQHFKDKFQCLETSYKIDSNPTFSDYVKNYLRKGKSCP